MKNYHSILFAAFIVLLSNHSISAQVVPDDTLGAENSTVRSIDNFKDAIEGGAIRGGNLFHSFEQFSIGDGFTAEFGNPEGIANIFSRVTGGEISEIFGTLGVNGSANLFLLNPNSILFGENAAINVGGSFMATTAESIEFDSGARFSVKDSNVPTLTIDFPIGLGMGRDPGSIIVRGEGNNITNPLTIPPLTYTRIDFSGLKTNSGGSLALIGGDISFDGAIVEAESGDLEIASVKTGEVSFASNSQQITFDFQEVEDFGKVNLLSKSFLSASGIEGGSISINAGEVNIQDGSIAVIENRGITTPSGDLSVKASDSINFRTTSLNSLFSGILTTQSLASGDLGQITISTPKLSAFDTALVTSVNFGVGSGGDISIDAEDFVIANKSNIGSVNLGAGRGGNVFVESNNLTALGSNLPENVATQTSVASGNFGTGTGGDIVINNSNDLNLSGGSNIGSANLGSGMGGDAFIKSDSINVSGVDPSGITVTTLSASTLNSGAAGNLSIDTSSLTIEDGAAVSSSTAGSGAAGTVTVNSTESIKVEGISSLNQNPSQIIAGGNVTDIPEPFLNPNQLLGNAGNVFINTPSLQILDGATVTVQNSGANNAGNLDINAESIFLDNTGTISASTVSGQGGNITLNTNNLELLGQSQITASAGGSGDGGNITIDSDTILGVENSDITANAIGGDGGNVVINSDFIVGPQARSQLTPFNDITATSEFGIDGTVTVNAPDTNVDEDLVVSAREVDSTQVRELLERDCRTGGRRGRNQLVYLGGGTRQSPDNFYDDTPIAEDRSIVRTPVPKQKNNNIPPLWSEGDPIVQPNAVQINPDGRKFLVAVEEVQSSQPGVCTVEGEDSKQK